MSMFRELDPVTDQELKYWLAFSQSGSGVGGARIKLLHERFHSLQIAWHASRDELKVIPGFGPETLDKLDRKRREIDPDELFDKLNATGVRAVASIDPAYPYRLRHVTDPPAVIFVCGNLPPPANMNYVCAIVGTRKATSYGLKVAKELARDLAQSGCVVASGMALGIDSVAHWGAIEGSGSTIAVLGCGPDVVYPPTNKKLYQAIIENNGCTISEHFPGTQPDKWMFPARNRIVSGISQAITIVEAPENSGALITADLGFQFSSEVFIVPGRIDAPTFKGSHKLVVQNKAHMVTCADDILQAMNWVTVPAPRSVPVVVELYGREKEVFNLLTEEPLHFDELCERTGMPAGEMSATLTMLELAGIAVRHPGDWYSRVSPNNPTPVLPM
jgi:DNA processing protein